MRLTPRQTLFGLALAGLIGVPLLLATYLSLGLWFAPPWPGPATSRQVAPLVAEALWARANGGANTDLNPFGPINLARLVFCMAQAEREGPGELRDAAQAECRRHHAPAFEAMEYLSGLHVQSAGFKEPGFREGHARFVTTIWMTRSWTKDELVNTLAERGEFGMRFRGLEAAAQGYFGVPAAQLTVPQAAMVAALIGGVGPDPWCDPEAASILRHRILLGMRDNGTIDERAYEAADRSELGLTRPSVTHPGCHG